MSAAANVTVYQMGVSVLRDASGAVIEVDGTAHPNEPLTPKGARIMARALLQAAEDVEEER